MRAYLPYLVAIISTLLSAATSAHAVMYKRESRAAAGWVGLIWLSPFLGPALYLLLGVNRSRRRAVARHARSPLAARSLEDDPADRTPEVDALCTAYAAAGATFSEPNPMLGGARIAAMPDGTQLGIRAPMADHEEPVTRPYWLVDDIDAALAAAEEAGGMVAHPPLEIPGVGTFAIYFLGDTQHGLWKK